MKKRFLTCLFACLLCPALALGESLVTYGGQFTEYHSGYRDFLAEHPGFSLDWPPNVYYSTAELTTALMTGSYACDVLYLFKDTFDLPRMMDKGYLLDLSGSDILTEAVSRMYPSIAQHVMRDGKLYALPDHVGFSYWRICRDVWEQVGLTDADVPQSFPAFLDFLDAWCDRIEDEPVEGVRVHGETGMTETELLRWLTGLLMDEAIMQMQYAGEPLHFDQEELPGLLERCEQVAKRLAVLERSSGPYELIEHSGGRSNWPRQPGDVLWLRLSDEQPKLMKTSLNVWAVYAGTEQPELAIELLEKSVQGSWDERYDELYLYQGGEPTIDGDYEENKAWGEAKLSEVMACLQAGPLTPDVRDELEKDRAEYERWLKNVEQWKWVMSAEQMADYQQAAAGLFIPGPDIFVGTGNLSVHWNLMDRFAAHQLNARQFLWELHQAALMIRMENE